MKILALTSFIFCMALQAANSINAPMVLPVTENVTVLQSKSDKELAWVDEQIQAILPARVGVSDGFINSLIDPIKYIHPVRIPSTLSSPMMNLLAPPKLGNLPVMPTLPKIVEEPLRLQALMNKSALVNGKWYKINDSIRTYTVAEIKPSSILLSGKKGQPLILFLNKTNTNIKINTK
ncbi:MAG: hypothetical protein Q8R86_09955 [Sulfuricurvum sp.]|nr:hypothetical protein [Sulfuricurvum sp.]MDP3466079.1 hypothetical protein [Sulfuricurvum sp.]